MNDIARAITTAEENDEFGGALKKRLDARLSKLATDNAAVVVRKYFGLLSDYRDMGMPWEVIAEELAALGCTITARSLSTTFSRAKKAVGRREQLAVVSSNVSPIEPPARNGGGQRDVPAQAKTPTSSPAVAAEVDLPAARKPGEQELIDRIVKTIPAPDREYPELAHLRFWEDGDGQRWDVTDTSSKAPTCIEFRRANVYYTNTRRQLLEKWGVGKIMSDSSLKLRYTLAEPPSLEIDLKQLVDKHLN
ncbi:hypothetical protein MASR1M60_22490 [Rhodocyclaceae bacterium]